MQMTGLSSSVRKMGIKEWIRYPKLKRLFDLLLSFFFLLLFSPLMLLIALWVKLSSQGPVLYRQLRIGKNGNPFLMLKFRTMRDGNNNIQHIEHVQRLILEDLAPRDLRAGSLKISKDNRITNVGRQLRKLSLDELPQFINVLRGEMSLVGPRPPLPYEYEVYEEWHKDRLKVLPGITGMWQVTARNQVRFTEMVRMDLEYINKRNLWLDIKIIIKTPFEMIKGKGAG